MSGFKRPVQAFQRCSVIVVFHGCTVERQVEIVHGPSSPRVCRMTSIPFKMHECHKKGLVADDTVGMTLPSEVFFEHPIP